jgi:hypothetical protein
MQKNMTVFFKLLALANHLRGFTNQLLSLLSYASLIQIGWTESHPV